MTKTKNILILSTSPRKNGNSEMLGLVQDLLL